MKKRIFSSKTEGRRLAQYQIETYLEMMRGCLKKGQRDSAEDYLNKLLGTYGVIKTLGLITYEEWKKATRSIIDECYGIKEV